jgi:hypothetical protein
MRVLLQVGLLGIAFTCPALAQKQLWSQNIPAKSVNGVRTTYSANMAKAFVGPTGDAIVVYEAISNLGARSFNFPEFVWITSKGKRAATFSLPRATFVQGVLHMTSSEVTLALSSGSKNLIQTFRLNRSKLNRIRTLEHGNPPGLSIPGLSEAAGMVDGGGFPNGFVGIREDGKGGLRIFGYGY